MARLSPRNAQQAPTKASGDSLMTLHTHNDQLGGLPVVVLKQQKHGAARLDSARAWTMTASASTLHARYARVSCAQRTASGGARETVDPEHSLLSNWVSMRLSASACTSAACSATRCRTLGT